MRHAASIRAFWTDVAEDTSVVTASDKVIDDVDHWRSSRAEPKTRFAPESPIRQWTAYPARAA